MRQDAATKVATQLVFDIARQVLAALLSHRREEGFKVFAHDEMERTVLWLATGVGPTRKLRCA